MKGMKMQTPLIEAKEPEVESIPLLDQIRCVEREIAKRMNVYPRLVESKRMTEIESRRQIMLMQAVLCSLRKLAR